MHAHLLVDMKQLQVFCFPTRVPRGCIGLYPYMTKASSENSFHSLTLRFMESSFPPALNHTNLIVVFDRLEPGAGRHLLLGVGGEGVLPSLPDKYTAGCPEPDFY